RFSCFFSIVLLVLCCRDASSGLTPCSPAAGQRPPCLHPVPHARGQVERLSGSLPSILIRAKFQITVLTGPTVTKSCGSLRGPGEENVATPWTSASKISKGT